MRDCPKCGNLVLLANIQVLDRWRRGRLDQVAFVHMGSCDRCGLHFAHVAARHEFNEEGWSILNHDGTPFTPSPGPAP